jgi:HD-GYP domain-containing protein (c-di-GMP phosphodiesterase class II)
MEMEDPVFRSFLRYTRALPVALGYRDVLTRLHSERVQGLSEQLGKFCGISQAELNVLKIAALFHDIGKIGIPDHILFKPSPLDEAEWEIMKQHSEIGEEIISATELEGSQQVALLVRHHHEHYDGLGYPDKLAGDNIPILSRIISIADSYDAMAVTRTYRRARSHLEIMNKLQEEASSKHDPELMRGFSEMIESSKFRTA